MRTTSGITCLTLEEVKTIDFFSKRDFILFLSVFTYLLPKFQNQYIYVLDYLSVFNAPIRNEKFCCQIGRKPHFD